MARTNTHTADYDRDSRKYIQPMESCPNCGKNSFVLIGKVREIQCLDCGVFAAPKQKRIVYFANRMDGNRNVKEISIFRDGNVRRYRVSFERGEAIRKLAKSMSKKKRLAFGFSGYEV